MTEEDIMVSGDNSLRLTNFRIIYITGGYPKDILLKDYKSSRITAEYRKVYRIRTIVSGILLFICLLLQAQVVFNFTNLFPMSLLDLLPAFIIALYLIVSIVLLTLSRRRYLKIESHLDKFIIPISGDNHSVHKFMKAIEKAKAQLNIVMKTD